MNRIGFLLAGMALLVAQGAAAASSPTAHLEVDAREAPRGIEKVHLELPVKPGKLTLFYPKWLPGEHAPNGPVGGISGLKFLVGGQPLAWARDPVEMYAFHVTVPAHAATLVVDFEVDSVSGAQPPDALRTTTDALAILLWNKFMLYPAGTQSDDLQVAAKLKLPSGWNFGTALPKVAAQGDEVEFSAVSLTTLIDSPVLAGRYFKTVDLGGTPAAYLHLAGDSSAAVEIPEAAAQQYRKLVQEAQSLFGATHYSEYHFLWALSDQLGYEGIEHHQSSDNRALERSLIDEDLRRSNSVATLLPHEYVHSWNGKYRRPAGLATGNYDAPMQGELLWVYEGLTQYLGMVLAARSGLWSDADARDGWADIAASAQATQGREWRPLLDTAVAAQIGYVQAPEWHFRTRGTDFYDESALLWLEADTLIRTKSGGSKSLDDFCKLFHGAPSSAPKVSPYTLDEVVNTLNRVLPFDWRGFWNERLKRLRAAAPLEGLAASGWRLQFSGEEPAEQKDDDAANKRASVTFSLGFSIADDGAVISRLVPGSPMDLAGAAPDSHLIAVNERKYSKEILTDALKGGGDQVRTIRLLVQKDDMFDTLSLRYAGHARYPHLERDGGTADLWTAIMTPHSP